MEFREIAVKDINKNACTLIGDGLLITAGDENKYNTMTASWGGLGVFWGKNAVTIYIRPQRYTRGFVDENDIFTISFLGDDHKKALSLCGSVSGREVNKAEKAGLNPVFEEGSTYFKEADMVLVCKKLYHTDIVPENFDNTEYDEKMYPGKDYHRIYIAEILKVLVK